MMIQYSSSTIARATAASKRAATCTLAVCTILLLEMTALSQTLSEFNCTQPGTAGQGLGSAVARVGDVDGDGTDDYVISASEVALVKMISGATGNVIFDLQGTLADKFGSALDAVGDVNNDGTNDWVVSAVGGPNTYVYIFSGTSAPIFRADNPWGTDSGYGYDVAGVGDMNNDGVPDFAIGAPGRGATSWPGGFEIRSGANNSVLARIQGAPVLAGSNLGISLAGVGDINHDGVNDIAVGATFYSGQRGFARIYSGYHIQQNIGPDVIWHWEGDASGDFFGVIHGSADFNHDGTPDVIVGAPRNAGGSGYVRVFSGASGQPLATLRRPQCDQTAQDYFGSRAALGYFDGDTNIDLVIGSPTYTGVGGVYGFSGKGFFPIFSQKGVAGERFGTSVTVLGTNQNAQSKVVVSSEWFDGNRGHACVFDVIDPRCGNPSIEQSIQGNSVDGYEGGVPFGDVDNDGFDDVITGTAVGLARVYSGRTGDVLRTHSGSVSDLFGNAVAAIGDIDVDGYGDYIVAASFGNYVKVYSGFSGTLLATHVLTEAAHAGYGYAVSGAGDVDGDGVPDYMVGAPGIGNNPWHGLFDVWSGATRTLIRRVRGDSDPSMLGSNLGIRLTALGDIDGDGLGDVAVGAIFYNNFQGKVFACTGALLTNRVEYPSDAAGIQSMTRWSQVGNNSLDSWGHVDRGADFNNDGIPDLFVGATQPFGGLGYLQILNGTNGNVIATIQNPSCSAAPFDLFGYQSATSDLDGDGHSDIVVSAPGLVPNGGVFVFSGANLNLLYPILGANGEHLGTEVSFGHLDGAGRIGLYVCGNEGQTEFGDNAGVIQVLTFGCQSARTPQFIWPAPADVIYGTLLGPTQLNATAVDPITGDPIAGTPAYSPGAGTLLPAGAGQTLSVTFTPNDTAHYTSVTQQVSITVMPAATTLALSSSANPAQLGDPVTFSATLSPASAGGTVNFFSTGSPIGTATVQGGQASILAPALAQGIHSIQAVYSGDGNHLASSNSLNQVVKTTISVTISLVDSLGGPLSGARAQYYSGGWHDIGFTDSNGVVSTELNPGSYNFSVDYAFGRTTMSQNISINPVVAFQTRRVVTRLLDSEGTPLAGATTEYYAGAWRNIGTTGPDGSVGIELLPGSYNFAVNYAFSRTTKTQNIAIDTNVVFQTLRVVTRLVDSAGAPLAGAHTEYYAGAWRNIGTTGLDGSVGIELLPGNYNFAVDYAYGRFTKVQNVSLDANIQFATTKVVAKLRDSAGTPLVGARMQYYAGAWRDIGYTDSNGDAEIELLAGNYNFAVDYAFGRNTKTQNVALDSNVVFSTTRVTTRLISSAGNPIAGAKTQYYAGAWRDIGFTDASGDAIVELLGGNYNFSVDYAFGRVTKTQNVSSNATVVFQTGLVHSGNGTCIQYYGGAWRTFFNDMELLPGSWNFKFNDGTPNTVSTIAAGVTNNIH